MHEACGCLRLGQDRFAQWAAGLDPQPLVQTRGVVVMDALDALELIAFREGAQANAARLSQQRG